jgi:hypothetical protein
MDADARCDDCGGLMNVLRRDYHDCCLACRLGRMTPYRRAEQ